MERNKRGEIRADGVIYTPSRETRAPQETRIVSTKIGRMPGNVRSRRRTARSKSGLALFFITTLFVGVLLCVLVFAFVFQALLKRGDRPIATDSAVIMPSITVEDRRPQGETQALSSVCLITNIDGLALEMAVKDLDTGKTFTIKAGTGTQMRDKYGGSLVFSEFAPGDVIEASFPGAGEASSIRQSPLAREYKDITQVKANGDDHKIIIGNEAYDYDDSLISLYKDAEFDVADIADIDVVTVRCYKTKACYVNVQKRSGVLIVEEYPDIFDGTLEIDTSSYVALGVTQEIRVTEGKHRLVVNGSNIRPYIDEINVAAGESYKIDLSGVEMVSGLLTVTISEIAAVVTIDGNPVDITREIPTAYGVHVIRAEKEGFLPYEAEITIAEAYSSVDIALTKETKLARLSIITDPTGALCYIDGQFSGVAPVTISVEYGGHTMTIRKDGYISIDIPVEVNLDNLSRMVILQQAY